MRKFTFVLTLAGLMAATPASADIVAGWSELLISVDKASAPTKYMFDPQTGQAWSKTSLAMFEAANAVDRRYVSYAGLPPAAKGASIEAAVSTAARDVMLACYPGQAQTINDAYTLALSRVPEGTARDEGVKAAKAAAVAALAAGGIDPKLGQAVYRSTATPGKWAPSSLPYDPRELQVRPWFMTNA